MGGGILACERLESVTITRNGEIRDHSRSETIDVHNANYYRALQEFNEKEKYDRSETYSTQLVYDVDGYLPSCPLRPEKAQMVNRLYEVIRGASPEEGFRDEDIDNIAFDIASFNQRNLGKSCAEMQIDIAASSFRSEDSREIIAQLFKDEASIKLVRESGFDKENSQDLYDLMYPLNVEFADTKYTKQPSAQSRPDWRIDEDKNPAQQVERRPENPLNIYERLACEFRESAKKADEKKDALEDIRAEVPIRKNPLDSKPFSRG